MPKKKLQESQAEQSARFKRDAQKLIDAGELNPVDADAIVDGVIRRQAKTSNPGSLRSSQ